MIQEKEIDIETSLDQTNIFKEGDRKLTHKLTGRMKGNLGTKRGVIQMKALCRILYEIANRASEFAKGELERNMQKSSITTLINMLDKSVENNPDEETTALLSFSNPDSSSASFSKATKARTESMPTRTTTRLSLGGKIDNVAALTKDNRIFQRSLLMGNYRISYDTFIEKLNLHKGNNDEKYHFEALIREISQLTNKDINFHLIKNTDRLIIETTTVNQITIKGINEGKLAISQLQYECLVTFFLRKIKAYNQQRESTHTLIQQPSNTPQPVATNNQLETKKQSSEEEHTSDPSLSSEEELSNPKPPRERKRGEITIIQDGKLITSLSQLEINPSLYPSSSDEDKEEEQANLADEKKDPKQPIDRTSTGIHLRKAELFKESDPEYKHINQEKVAKAKKRRAFTTDPSVITTMGGGAYQSSASLANKQKREEEEHQQTTSSIATQKVHFASGGNETS